MGDRVRVRLPEAALYFGMYLATEVDSAFYPPWDGKMSTSQRAVMLCGWECKSPADRLPVHRDHVRAQRSVTSMGSLYLYLYARKCLSVLQRRCDFI